MNLIATFGCWACKIDGIENDFISLHHVDGRTKPNAHSKVIPLCAEHHEYWSKHGLHHNKKQWEQKYGTQQNALNVIHKHFGIEL